MFSLSILVAPVRRLPSSAPVPRARGCGLGSCLLSVFREKHPNRITLLSGSPWWKVKGEFEVGETKVVSGRITRDKFAGNLIMSSPDVVAPLADLEKVGKAPVRSTGPCGRCRFQNRTYTCLAATSNRYRMCTRRWV